MQKLKFGFALINEIFFINGTEHNNTRMWVNSNSCLFVECRCPEVLNLHLCLQKSLRFSSILLQEINFLRRHGYQLAVWI